ncbi:MAG: SCO family protein [Gemmataceae bacterium]|nr:SCO family protein [Gemmata sp.]MDW8196563.1 SCO family protein [Gemmataceae bacterium]
MTVGSPIRQGLLFGLAVLVALPALARAGNDGVVPRHTPPEPPGYRPNAGVDEKIGAQLPLDLTFRDEEEQPITLREAINNKPTILVPVYYRCPMLCNEILNGLLTAIRQMPRSYSVGEQFSIVTISMDPKEHGDLAKAKKKAYLSEYGRPGAERGWRFLTGTKDNIGALLDAVGYRFEFDKMLKEYNHPSALIIVSPQGKVTRYFYGLKYDGEFELDADVSTDRQGQVTRPTTTLRLSLIEANDGQGGSLLDKITLLCYRYDALHKGYALNVLWAVRIGGIITLLAVVIGVIVAFRREWRHGTVTTAQTPATTTLPTPELGGQL